MRPALGVEKMLPDQSTELTNLGARTLPDTTTGKRREEETRKRLFDSTIQACHYTEELQGQTRALITKTGTPSNSLPYLLCLLA